APTTFFCDPFERAPQDAGRALFAPKNTGRALFAPKNTVSLSSIARVFVCFKPKNRKTMPEKLPNRASIDFEPLMIHDGLSGLVEALHHIVGFQIRAAEDSPGSLTISEHKNDSKNKAQ